MEYEMIDADQAKLPRPVRKLIYEIARENAATYEDRQREHLSFTARAVLETGGSAADAIQV